jgi:hypothetical protein
VERDPEEVGEETRRQRKIAREQREEDQRQRERTQEDITAEVRRSLAINSLVERLGVDPRLAEYLLELRERIEKLEDRLGAP